MSRQCRWIYPEVDCAGAAAIASALGIEGAVARVLWKRGFHSIDAAYAFFSPTLDGLHDPFLLKGMQAAVERLHRAILSKEQILLYGDYDVDGTSSVVILTKALQLAGANVRFHVPHRLRDGYGMHPEAIETAAREGVTLIVSVDTGIRAVSAVRHAHSLGVDCIITDHHLPDSEIPHAYAVINPNQVGCCYPEKNLCGAGVTFKLVQALWQVLGLPDNKVRRLSESFLKLVALATVADVVPLTGENRILVHVGLKGFQDVRNAGLRALLEVSGIKEGDCPSAGQVAFRLAPRLNAAGRMSNAEDVVHLFLTEDAERAKALAQQLHELNADRQGTEREIVQIITDECGRVPVQDDHCALVFHGQGWHRGVIGIVASRLVDRYQRPVFVLGEEEGVAQGSGRSIAAFHLLEALESMSGLFTKFGGHRQAAGLTLPAERIVEFRARLNEYASHRLTQADFRPTLEVDSTVTLEEITSTTAGQILQMAPFGCGNPAPVLVAQGVEVCGEPSPLGEKHLRIRLRQNGAMVSLKAWNFAARRAELTAGSRVNAAFIVEEDSYGAARGYAPWSLVLKDVEPF